MKTTAIVAGVLALGLVGGGVAAYALTNTEEPTAAVEQTESPTPVASEPSATPNAISTPEVTAGAPRAVEDADALFLAEVRKNLQPTTQIADAADADLIAAGHQACELLRDGKASDDMRLIEGEEPAPSGYYMDTAAIVMGARLAYCQDTIY